MKSHLFYCLSFILISFYTQAQELQPCSAFERNLYYESKYPETVIAKQNLERYTNEYKEGKAAVVYIIPVVFHILHEYGVENISDAQVQNAVNHMNEDYRKLNADTANIVAAFKPIAADCEIEFRLAKLDPNGNCTNGIDRINTSLTNQADDNSKLNPWPRNKYLNIWVVKTIGSGAAGYSMYPSSVSGGFGASVDGIMVLHSYVGSIGTSTISHCHTLSHEAGHWMNLKHCWGDSNSPGLSSNCSLSDNVSDTPATIGWTSCNLNGSSCGSALDNVQNYMEYSYCSCMFTQGQRTRMRAALTSNTAQRNNLWTSSNLIATGVNSAATACAPIADFYPAFNQICANEAVQFNDASFNGTPTTWSWTFNGGSPSTSTLQNPIVTYAGPGTYSVSLTVTNAAGSNSVTKLSEITVISDAAQITNGQYFENFETVNLSSGPITLQNDGNGWGIFTNAGFSGTRSIYLNLPSNNPGDKDAFILPGIDLTQFTTPFIYYRVAYAQLPSSTSNLNSLKVYTSTDCGSTWLMKRVSTGNALATVPAQAATFVPSGEADWRQDNFSLNTLTTQNNLLIKFEFTSEDGNRIYIDDININQPTGSELLNLIGNSMEISPNPSTGDIQISLDIPQMMNLSLSIFDITGRHIDDIQNGKFEQGTSKITYNIPGEAGIYLIKLQSNQGECFRKVVKY